MRSWWPASNGSVFGPRSSFEPLDWTCAAVRGPEATRGVTGSPELTVPASFATLAGVDLLGPLPDRRPRRLGGRRRGAEPDDGLGRRRIEAGLPVNGRELVAGTIAAEVGLVERTVSFTKGCFTGQELVARLDARGSNVARHLRGVVLAGPTDDEVAGPDRTDWLVGSSVSTSDGEHEVGHLSSVAWSPALGAPVALATLHRRIVPPEAVTVRWTAADGTSRHHPGQARVLPISGA